MLEVAEDELREGSVVGGFRLERLVGQGGMGAVWAARTKDGRAVALKFLLDGRDDAKARARFLREARAAMAVNHPHVASVEAVLETDVGTPFLVMELLSGESMRLLLRRRAPLSVYDTARLVLPIVEGVAAAHALGIVHRDLKPENVFLQSTPHGEQVRVLDFGIAKQLPRGQGDTTASASLTSTGALIGTPAYMAPEQVFGDQDIDVRADVWSLGIILYECLAARRPTDAEGFGQIIKRILTERFVPIRDAAPAVRSDPALATIVDQMLARERHARPPLAAVAAVLRTIVLRGDAPAPRPMTHPLAAPLAVPTLPSGPPPGMTTRAPAAGPSPGATSIAVDPRILEHHREKNRTVLYLVLAIVGFVVVPGGIAIVIGLYRIATDPTYLPGQPVRGVTPDEAGSIFGAEGGAKVALDFKDPKTCLVRLAQRDTIAQGTNVKLSTDPRDESSELRAHCTMLDGRCEEGKALLRRRLATTSSSRDAAAQERRVIADAAKYCAPAR